MIAAQSLTWRLIRNLVLAQMVVVSAMTILAELLTPTGATNFSYDYWSILPVRDMVIASLARDSEGMIYIDVSESLAAELRRTPTLKYAVFKSLSDDAVRGSSPELSAVIRKIANADTRGMDFFVSYDQTTREPGSVWQWDTPVGPLFVATSGTSFHWSDLLYFWRKELPATGANLIAIGIVSSLTAWIAVHNGLAPLRRAAEAANDIDMGRVGQGIPIEGVPIETRPLIDSVNRALARLDASAARMRRYVANAAHELRTPVAILRARLDNPEEFGFKTDLMRDARRLQAIVEQLLTFARLKEGHAALDHETDLVGLIRTIVGDYAPLAVKTQRKIEFEAEEQSSYTRCNPQAIECVIVNLIDNALRAAPNGGTVLIRCRRNGIVEVIDHGDGIKLEDREKIFEPFWRKRDAALGAGLGLSITKEILDAHGGEIRVEETPGGGATFRLLFKQLPQNHIGRA